MMSVITKISRHCNSVFVKGRLSPVMLNWKAVSSEVKKAQEARDSKHKKTVFDKVISKEIKVDVIYEDDECIAFNDVAPQAPTHFLVIPKRKIATLDDSGEDDKELLGSLLLTARRLAKERLPKGYRVVINNGVEGCQSVYYLHIHVLGGRQLKWPPG